MNIRLELFNKLFVFSFYKKNIRGEAIGYTNRCADGKYIIQLDYDYMNEEWINDELRDLQKLFNLSTFYIFKTNKGCHAVCFDKLPLITLCDLLKNTSIDPDFMDVPMKIGYKLWNLRLTMKDSNIPRYIYCIPSYNCTHRKSRAHMDLIENYFPDAVKDLDKANQDDLKKVILRKYIMTN